MLNKIFKKNNPANENILRDFFNELENSESSCFELAMNSFFAIKDQCESEEDFLTFLLEDSLYTSLYATFYEHLLVGVHNNQDVAIDLIRLFKDQTDSREQILANQSHDHFNYITNGGKCPGCASCDNHQDVNELIAPFAQGDLNFFAELYVGMLTIQFAMESLIYDLIPNNIEVSKILTQQNILQWRQYIYEYAKEKMSQL